MLSGSLGMGNLGMGRNGKKNPKDPKNSNAGGIPTVPGMGNPWDNLGWAPGFILKIQPEPAQGILEWKKVLQRSRKIPKNPWDNLSQAGIPSQNPTWSSSTATKSQISLEFPVLSLKIPSFPPSLPGFLSSHPISIPEFPAFPGIFGTGLTSPLCFPAFHVPLSPVEGKNSQISLWFSHFFLHFFPFILGFIPFFSSSGDIPGNFGIWDGELGFRIGELGSDLGFRNRNLGFGVGI